MEIEVVKFDNLGRGIGYLDNKIIFIPKTVPGDIVRVKIIKNKKNFLIGELTELIKPSKLRVKAICPLFNTCGGCDLMHISLSEALDYKLNKVNDILKKNNLDFTVKNIIKSKDTFYRNKITLKIKDGEVGYYKSESHEVVETNYCYLASDCINEIIKDIPLLKIQNGEITIRCNFKNEIILIINSLNTLENFDKLVKKYALVGVIQNDMTIYGEDYFMERVGDYLFKVSYNSFFQVNNEICAKLFSLIKENTKDSQKVLDLYCGVGTLSIGGVNSSIYTLGVEIIPNAIDDANLNKIINKKENSEFICEDTSNILNKIEASFDTVIMDPPRSGVSEKVLDKIIRENISKIIYVSCDANTLARDLKILSSHYEIKDITLLDMFPNTEHVESIAILSKKG